MIEIHSLVCSQRLHARHLSWLSERVMFPPSSAAAGLSALPGGDRDATAGLADLHVGGVDPQMGQSPSIGRSRRAFTRWSTSSQRRLTPLLEMPVMHMVGSLVSSWSSQPDRKREIAGDRRKAAPRYSAPHGRARSRPCYRRLHHQGHDRRGPRARQPLAQAALRRPGDPVNGSHPGL